MATNGPTPRRISPTQWLIAGSIVLAGALVGAGVLGAAYIADDGDDLARPRRVQPSPSPSETDPAVLHEENQEGSRLTAEEDLEAALQAAALAQENYYKTYKTYTSNLADLSREGFRHPPGVMFSSISVTSDVYCMEAQHDDLPSLTFSYFSPYGEVRRETCPV